MAIAGEQMGLLSILHSDSSHQYPLSVVHAKLMYLVNKLMCGYHFVYRCCPTLNSFND